MILDKIQERVQRLASGGIITDENRWDKPYVVSVIIAARAALIRKLYTGDRYTAANKRINNVAYQDFYPEYSTLLQEGTDGCYVMFEVPPVISLTKNSDGFRYVGSDNSINFKRIHDEAELAMLNNLSKFAPADGTYVSYWFDGHFIRIYGQNVKSPKVSAIFQNPLDIPTYNASIDNFPLAEDDIPELESMIFNARSLKEITIVPDSISDSDESLQQIKK